MTGNEVFVCVTKAIQRDKMIQNDSSAYIDLKYF